MVKAVDVRNLGKYVLLETAAGALLIAEYGLWAGSYVVRPIATLASIPAGLASAVTLNPTPAIAASASAATGPLVLDSGSKLVGWLRKQAHQAANNAWYKIGVEEKPDIPLEDGWLKVNSDQQDKEVTVSDSWQGKEDAKRAAAKGNGADLLRQSI